MSLPQRSRDLPRYWTTAVYRVDNINITAATGLVTDFFNHQTNLLGCVIMFELNIKSSSKWLASSTSIPPILITVPD